MWPNSDICILIWFWVVFDTKRFPFFVSLVVIGFVMSIKTSGGAMTYYIMRFAEGRNGNNWMGLGRECEWNLTEPGSGNGNGNEQFWTGGNWIGKDILAHLYHELETLAFINTTQLKRPMFWLFFRLLSALFFNFAVLFFDIWVDVTTYLYF